MPNQDLYLMSAARKAEIDQTVQEAQQATAAIPGQVQTQVAAGLAPVAPALQQVADSIADIAQLQQRLGATSLLYLSSDPDGSANIATLGGAASASLTFADETLPLVGVVSVPTLEVQ